MQTMCAEYRAAATPKRLTVAELAAMIQSSSGNFRRRSLAGSNVHQAGEHRTSLENLYEQLISDESANQLIHSLH